MLIALMTAVSQALLRHLLYSGSPRQALAVEQFTVQNTMQNNLTANNPGEAPT